MKTLLLILIPFFAFSQIKIDDYQKHFIISVNLASHFSSSAYFLTKKPLVAALIGMGTALTIGVAKEFIYDGYLKKGTKSMIDLDADGRGTLSGAFFSFGIIDTIDKKRNTLDATLYQNLNKK